VYGFGGTSETDLWAVGENVSGVETIAHFDGIGWTLQPSAATNNLLAVWALTPSDAWIASDPPLHWSGSVWTAATGAPSAQYNDVWAASATAVYFAIGAGVQWWNGSTFQQLGALVDPIVSLRGASANDVWAAKADGSLVHWNGTLWSPVAVDVTVRKVDVLSASSVWVIGPSTQASAAAVASWNGASWTTYTDPSTSADSFATVLAIADNDVWVSGPLGEVRHFDGIAWTNSSTRVTTDAIAGFVGMKKVGDVVVGAAFNGIAHRYRGQMFGRLNTLDTNPVQSVWSAGPNATFVGDLRGNVIRYNGMTWTKHVLDTTSIGFSALWGSSASDVFASGSSGHVSHWNGSGWTQLTTTIGGVSAIWGTSPTNVYLFGSTITKYDGNNFTPETVTGNNFSAASGSGPSDIWALSPGTAAMTNVYRYNGSVWTSTPLPHDMTAIVVVAPNDVFVTADTNHVLHYDGSTWTDTVVPVSTRLDHIAASAHDDVVASSPSEAVHFDGTRWTPLRVALDANATIRGLSVAPGYIDFLSTSVTAQVVRRLIRTRFWNCRATETGCSDGVDDDCDGSVDALDADCP
ncbi:MAG TPA: hypothetical protein VIV40_28310, partial [Kofleriaceae bacterium]